MEASMAILLVVLAIVVIMMLSVAVYLTIKLIRLSKLVHNELMPLKGKVAFWGGILYTVFPLDVLVDPIYLDDVGILVAVIAYVTKLVNEHGITRGGRSMRMPERSRSSR